MKVIPLLILIFLTINSIADEALFEKANLAYDRAEIAQAIILYDSILSNGVESSQIYYNLGNCYYKKNDWANAIWHYEKSLKINNSKKTRENLHLTKKNIIDKIKDLPQIFYKKWWTSLYDFLSTKQWQYLAILSIILALILLVINQTTKKDLKKYYISAISSSLLILLISNSSYYHKIEKKEAIIFSSTSIKSAPSLNSNEIFSLHSGTKIEIIDRIEDWVHFTISDGKSGWLLKNSIKEL